MTTAVDSFQLLAILIIVYYFLIRPLKNYYSYFNSRNVKFIAPVPILGNIAPVIFKQMSYIEAVTRSYNYADNERYYGMYNLWRPTFYLKDPALVSRVLKEDFESFSDRGMMFNPELDPLSANLFFTSGQLWKDIRSKLSPVFTSGKLKSMLPFFLQAAEKFEEYLGLKRIIEAKEEMSKYSLDVIASTAFGIETNSFFKETTKFRKMVQKVFTLESKQAFALFIRLFKPDLATFLGLKCVPQDVEEFFLGVVKETISKRKSTGEMRNDFIQLMMDLQDNETFTDNLVAAQAFIFLLAGFETTSVTLSFALYFLGRNLQVQDHLREEVATKVQKYGSITYEALKEMPYLEAVINESLRLFPPVGGFVRVCTKRYLVPDSDIILEQGDLIGIPAYAIHRDPDNYYSPNDFVPERWIEWKPKQGSFIPFGDGPRICIAQRFAMLSMKTVIARLILNYKISSNKKTPLKLEFTPDSLFYITKSGLWVNMERIPDCSQSAVGI